MPAPRNVYTYSVHTRRGRRFFHLAEGSIADTPADMIVASTHSDPSRPVTGEVIRVLRGRFGIKDAEFQPLILPRPGTLFGSYWQECGERLFLLLRTPRAASTG